MTPPGERPHVVHRPDKGFSGRSQPVDRKVTIADPVSMYKVRRPVREIWPGTAVKPVHRPPGEDFAVWISQKRESIDPSAPPRLLGRCGVNALMVAVRLSDQDTAVDVQRAEGAVQAEACHPGSSPVRQGHVQYAKRRSGLHLKKPAILGES